MAYRTEPLLTPKFRARWVELTQPDKNGKYHITMIWPKDTDLKALKDKVIEAIKGEWGDRFKPSQLSLPFRDGNEKTNKETGEVYPEYVDTTWARANTRFTVTALDLTKGKKPVPAAELAATIYDGCYCIAQVHAYAWEITEEKNGRKFVTNRGVSFQLDNLLKFADGERVGGGGKKLNAEDAFADIAADADDPTNYQTEEKGSDWDL